MTDLETRIMAYFNQNKELSIHIEDLVQDLHVSNQDIVESLRRLQQADLIQMITREYGRITEKGIEKATG